MLNMFPWSAEGKRAQSSIKNKIEIPKGYLSDCFVSAFFQGGQKEESHLRKGEYFLMF